MALNWSLQHKRDTAANWTANNPTLLAGQLGIETDNLTTTPKFKVGDGTTAWNSLPYFYGGSLSAQDIANVLSVGNDTGGLSLKMNTGTTYYGATNQTHIQNVSGLELHNSIANTLCNLTDAGLWKVDAVQYMPNLTASRILSLDANKNIVNETGTGILTLNAGVISYDTNTYLTTSAAALTYQPLDADLTSWASVTRASGFDTFTATPSSANLASLVTDETGSGALVFGTSPTFTTDITTPKVIGVSGNLLFTNAAQTSGAITNFTFTNSANTGQTASTEISNFKVTGNTKTWANGGGATTIATQRWNHFTANTAATSGGGSLTITNSYGAYFEAATASGVTITNNYAAGFLGNILVGYDSSNYISTSVASTGEVTNTLTGTSKLYNISSSGSTSLRINSSAVATYLGCDGAGGYVGTNTSHAFRILAGNTQRLSFASGTGACTVADGLNFTFNTTTGSKFGTATTEKIGFWNATPIVQPTTAYAAGAFTANAGTAVNDASTFDGYTLKQIVAALRGIGLLA